MNWRRDQSNLDLKEIKVSCFNSIDLLPNHCSDLFLAGEKNSYDLSADWYRLIESAALSPDKQPRYCVLLRNNEVKGVLPLISKRGLWGKQIVSMTNFYSSLYCPLLSPLLSTEELAKCIRNIIRSNNPILLRFDSMDPTHPSFEIMETACNMAGLKPFRFFGFGNWYLPVEGRSFEEYYKGLPSRIRNTIRRRKLKFFNSDRGKIELITGGDGLGKAITAWEKIYTASWKKSEPFPKFIPGLIRMCAAKGWLRMGIAYYDGAPVAAQIWIVSHDRAVIYKLAYNEKFANLSIGTLLMAHLMAHVLDIDKVHEVDFLIGDDAYKKDWMSHRRERWGIVAYNPYTALGVLLALLQILTQFKNKLATRQGKH